MPDIYEPVTIFILAPGAFLVLAFLVAARNKIMKKLEAKERKLSKRRDAVKADALHAADATDTCSRQVRKRNRREIRDERITYYSSWFGAC